MWKINSDAYYTIRLDLNRDSIPVLLLVFMSKCEMFEITVIVGTLNYLWGKAPHNFGIPDAPVVEHAG